MRYFFLTFWCILSCSACVASDQLVDPTRNSQPKTFENLGDYLMVNDPSRHLSFFNNDGSPLIGFGDLTRPTSGCQMNKEFACIIARDSIRIFIPKMPSLNALDGNYLVAGTDVSLIKSVSEECKNSKDGNYYLMQTTYQSGLEPVVMRYGYSSCRGLDFFAFGILNENFFEPKSIFVPASDSDRLSPDELLQF